MINQYLHAIYGMLGSVIELLTGLALPLSVGLGMAVLAGALILAFQRDSEWLRRLEWRRFATATFGYVAVAVVATAGWAALRVVQPTARQDIQWRESAVATANPTPDAPPVSQAGPVVAALIERTYTRTLTLPPQFLQRVGAEGVGVLSPYLTDPSAENVLRLVDTFRRSGQDVVFTRQMTRLDEEPIPVSSSQIRVRFQRLPGRAYDSDFEGRYVFQNSGPEPIKARFLFNIPQTGTVRNLSLTVGDQAVTEPNKSGAYEWSDQMAAGERREAVVRYRIIGAGSWHYDLGSQRRRVEQFRLDASSGGPVRFTRGSLQPTANTRGELRWELANVVTAQQIGVSFPPNIVGRDSYLQALSALPASFLLFLLAAVALALASGSTLSPGRLLCGVVLFGFGLGAAAVLANYIGPIAGVILGPAVGALLASAALGFRSLPATLATALLPATFLSPQHTGLLALLLGVAALLAMLATARIRPAASRTAPAPAA